MNSPQNDIYTSSTQLLSEYLNGGPAKEYVTRVSSGTTHALPRVLVRHHRAIEFGGEAFERPIIAYGSLNTKLVRLSNFLFYCKQGIRALVVQETHLTPDIERLLIDFNPDSVWGSPSFISRIATHINNTDLLNGIKTLRLSGELLSTATRTFLKHTFPNARIITTYGSSETGNIGTTFLCPFQSDNEKTYYHTPPGVTVEIDTPDTTGAGELLVSKKVDALKLTRHRTGDIARIIKDRCLCGNPTTFEILGRKDFDVIKLAGATLQQEIFDGVMDELRPYIQDYRVSAEEDFSTGSLLGKITIHVLPTKRLEEEKLSERRIQHMVSSRLFLTPTRTLEELVEDGVFLPLIIEYVTQFETHHKEIKIRRI